jgi:hypothetical protein
MVLVVPVVVLAMVTSAPLTTACEVSEIVPRTVPLAVACPIIALGARSKMRNE